MAKLELGEHRQRWSLLVASKSEVYRSNDFYFLWYFPCSKAKTKRQVFIYELCVGREWPLEVHHVSSWHVDDFPTRRRRDKPNMYRNVHKQIGFNTYTCFDVFEGTFITANLHQFHRTSFIGHVSDQFTNEIANEFDTLALFLRIVNRQTMKKIGRVLLGRVALVEHFWERISPICDPCEGRQLFHTLARTLPLPFWALHSSWSCLERKHHNWTNCRQRARLFDDCTIFGWIENMVEEIFSSPENILWTSKSFTAVSKKLKRQIGEK